jgi:uncharacterized membrane protein YkvA (DUF1232 family)
VPTLAWIAVAVVGLYLVLVVGLLVAGRRTDARAWAGFIPDCIVLFQRLARDRRLPRSRRALMFWALAYLALPIDLVPDFIPVAGQLDDAILVGLALRAVMNAAGREIIRGHWSGPPQSLRVIERLAGSG